MSEMKRERERGRGGRVKRETKALDISYTIHNSQEWNEERKAREGEGSVKWEKKQRKTIWKLINQLSFN